MKPREDRLTYGKLRDFLNYLQAIPYQYGHWTEMMEDTISNIEINELLKTHHNHEIITAQDREAWRTVFANHYQRMKQINMEYTCVVSSHTNMTCLVIANLLSPVLGVSRVELLLPTLESYESVITSTNLIDDPICLSAMVISSDEKSFIEVRECLMTAKEDGKLKHTQLFANASPILLPEADIVRVCGHSEEANEFYNAIQQRFRAMHDGTTVGACLQRLIEGLRGGGSHRSGDEMNAGELANLAIIEFAKIYESMPEGQRKNLDAIVDSLDRPFLHYWKILATEQHEKFDRINACYQDDIKDNERDLQERKISENDFMIKLTQIKNKRELELSRLHANIQTCVELTSNGLTGIINNNKDMIFSMRLDNSIASLKEVVMSSLDENVHNKEHWFKWRMDRLARFEKPLYTDRLDAIKSNLELSELYRISYFDAEKKLKLQELVAEWIRNSSDTQFKFMMEYMLSKLKIEVICNEILPMLNQLQRNWCLIKIIDRLDDQAIIQISAGRMNTSYLTSCGKVYIMGTFEKSYRVDDKVVMNTPTMIEGLPDDAEITHISNGHDHVLMLDKDGRVYVYGSNYYGQSGLGVSTEFNERAVEVTSFPSGAKINYLAASCHSFFIDQNDNVYCSGYGSDIGMFPGKTPKLVANSFCKIVPNWKHVLFLNSTGMAYGCGYNLQGCLFHYHRKKIKHIYTPTYMMSGICQIAAGCSHSLFLSKDGKVYGMGSIGDGQLANCKDTDNQFETDILSPLLLDCFPAGTNVCKIAAARNASFFLTEKGEVYVCGANDEGQIGLGNVKKQFMPARVEGFPAGTEIFDIIAGYDHTIFIARNGQRYGCGSNLKSQFGCIDSLDKMVYKTVVPIKWTPAFALLKEEARKAVEMAKQIITESTAAQRDRLFSQEQAVFNADIIARNPGPNIHRK